MNTAEQIRKFNIIRMEITERNLDVFNLDGIENNGMEVVKQYLRVHHDEENEIIKTLSFASAEVIEKHIRDNIMRVEKCLSLDLQPYEPIYIDGKNMFVSESREVVVKTVMSDGTETIEPKEKYTIFNYVDGGYMIEINEGETWTYTDKKRGVFKIYYSYGHDSYASVPERIRLAMLTTIAHFYENREEAILQNSSEFGSSLVAPANALMLLKRKIVM